MGLLLEEVLQGTQSGGRIRLVMAANDAALLALYGEGELGFRAGSGSIGSGPVSTGPLTNPSDPRPALSTHLGKPMTVYFSDKRRAGQPFDPGVTERISVSVESLPQLAPTFRITRGKTSISVRAAPRDRVYVGTGPSFGTRGIDAVYLFTFGNVI